MNMCESYSCSQSTSKPIQLESNWKPLDHRCQRKPAYMIMLNFPTVLDSEWLGGWFLFVCFCQLMKTNLVWWSIWSEKQTWGYFPSTQSGQVYACLTLGRNKFLDQCLSKYSLHIPHHWGSWKAATMHQVDILLNRDWHLKKKMFRSRSDSLKVFVPRDKTGSFMRCLTQPWSLWVMYSDAHQPASNSKQVENQQ